MIPLHQHSYFSALDGWSSPAEIARRVGDLGLPGAFLTDHGTVAGLYQFRKEMKKAGLFAGMGMEAYQTQYESREIKISKKQGEDTFHLVLVAETWEGYQNLMRISDDANRRGFHYRPRTDFEMLEKYKDGIIATSACMGSLINEYFRTGRDELALEKINKFCGIFGDKFFIEIHTYDTPEQRELNLKLVDVAMEKGIPMVYANDAHYALPIEHQLHEAFMAAQYGQKLAKDMHPGCLYIMSEDDVRESLYYLPESVVDHCIASSDDIGGWCEAGLHYPEKSGTFLPKYKAPEDKTSISFFLDLLEAGIYDRYGDEETNPEAWERAEKEARAIVGAGLHDYFLIVWDYVADALRHGRFVGPGRGSVGGSIIAYALGITNIDPLQYNLPFERFWNPGRSAGLPDIDIDFGREGRLAEIEYVKRKYGVDSVIPIGNHSFMWPKSALDRAAQVWPRSLDYLALKRAKEIIESTTDAGHLKHWQDMINDLDVELRKELDRIEHSSDDMESVFFLAQAFDTRLHTYSVHASAVVITEADIPTNLPCRNAKEEEGTDRVLVTQAEMHQVEEEGFPKFDFLGLRNLDTLMQAGRLTGKFNSDAEIVAHFRDNQTIDADIPEEGWQLLDRGQTLGIFQIEDGQGIRRIVNQYKPRNIMDLAIVSGLNRPGPLRSGDTERYIKRRNGEEPVTYPHETLEDILETTYGVFAFQEQVINFFVKIGYSLSEADHIRKIIGKKLRVEMDSEKPRYVERASLYMSEAKAESIWTLIENFSEYGFNAAHSIGYAIITAWTLWAKYHWPTEFYMASIQTNPKKIGGYVEEARARGITVKGPSVAKSKSTISLDEDRAIRYGYSDIKGIGEAAAVKIMNNMPYTSAYDYLERCEANMGIFKILNRAGAFDEFNIRMVECTTCEGRGKRADMVPKKTRPEELKRVLVPCEDCNQTGWQEGEMPSDEVIAQNEEELLGLVVTDLWSDTIKENQDEIDRCGSWEQFNDPECTSGKVPGIIKDISHTTVKKGRYKGSKMAHVTIRWVNGEDERVAVFSELWGAYGSLLKKNRVGVFTLGRNDRGFSLKKAKVFHEHH